MPTKLFKRVLELNVPGLTKEQLAEICLDVPIIDLLAIEEQERRLFKPRRSTITTEKKEPLVLYKVLYDVMRELANLRLPIAALFQRYEAPSLKREDDLPKFSFEMGDFRDARLHHLKFDYNRKQLQPENISFANDP